MYLKKQKHKATGNGNNDTLSSRRRNNKNDEKVKIYTFVQTSW